MITNKSKIASKKQLGWEQWLEFTSQPSRIFLPRVQNFKKNVLETFKILFQRQFSGAKILTQISGVILFIRMPWIVGLAGIWGAFGLVAFCCLTTLLTGNRLLKVFELAAKGLKIIFSHLNVCYRYQWKSTSRWKVKIFYHKKYLFLFKFNSVIIWYLDHLVQDGAAQLGWCSTWAPP